jgi:DnaK suppressor protein
MFKEREMPARKPVPKSGKAKKPAATKSAAKKPVAPHKPAAKAVPPVRAVAAPKTKSPVKPVVKDLDKKPAVTAIPKRPEPKKPSIAPRPTPPVDVSDDNETNDSLLAGPRNVQPYVAKRGEQYMSKEQLDHFRQILSNWKQDLMLEVDRTVSHMKDEAANFPDPNDRATQEEEFSLELRTRDRERKLIRKIEEAIKRIEDGSYGYCLETGEQIGIKRLEARPVATLSIEAQERRERREKQYGDRDDRYR